MECGISVPNKVLGKPCRRVPSVGVGRGALAMAAGHATSCWMSASVSAGRKATAAGQSLMGFCLGQACGGGQSEKFVGVFKLFQKDVIQAYYWLYRPFN